MQQINLYLPEFRPNREPLRSQHMLWLAVGLLVLLVLFSIYSSYRNSQMRAQVAEEQAALQAAQMQLQQLGLLQPKNLREQLETEIAQLLEERDRRAQIFTIISRQDMGNTSGFSAHMEALARQSMDTLALDKFSLQRGGSYVEFSGTTRRADQIPVYLQRLRSEASFAEVDFGVLTVERAERSDSLLKFKLERAEEEDAAKAVDTYFAEFYPGGRPK